MYILAGILAISSLTLVFTSVTNAEKRIVKNFEKEVYSLNALISEAEIAKATDDDLLSKAQARSETSTKHLEELYTKKKELMN